MSVAEEQARRTAALHSVIVAQPLSVAPAPAPPEVNAEPQVVVTADPTIQVTIGRIEVRAIPSDSRPQSQKPGSARLMGLDDYLRQRAQGAKR